ncbi:MurT ligase domain-containing protein [Anaerocellum danielii]|uniref:Lipid II isoglutaminyl synthase (glutamine-hydrolyzing) subunit MurT n=1 Tax=Anaerocellum danielii TaxID=1387557 RepID=A0ABZ0TYI6_9FIRM|nr:MurT ligase domain-containing protein [Caldicellulosiruptor danielii]WPX07937.1 MurT ligase domain-containing protein [Caldicellulosiruptor danielii]
MQKIRFYVAILLGMLVKFTLKLFRKDATSAPGKIALKICPSIMNEIDKRSNLKILISGTNGKTTTNNIINRLIAGDKVVLSNLKGSNMANGIVSSFINNFRSSYDIACFEVDEGSLPVVTRYLKPDIFVTTNVFRDQLDRYGELDRVKELILNHIGQALAVINADDPNLASFSGKKKVFYSVDENLLSRRTNVTLDSRFCPLCNAKLEYLFYNVGHLGKYECFTCGYKNPESRFVITNIREDSAGFVFDFVDRERDILIENIKWKINGVYNLYNVCAAISVAMLIGVEKEKIKERIETFENKLRRLEKKEVGSKKVIISLVKNPIGMSETLNVISKDPDPKVIVFILNDNAADGKDVSWIWDVDFDILDRIENIKALYFSGKRKEDMALRVKYSEYKLFNFEMIDYTNELGKVFELEEVKKVYILPTYTALFEVKRIVYNLSQKDGFKKWR